MLKQLTIILPSFLRRVLRAYALKAEIRALGCELSRVGRSRNWQLTASPEQINEVILLIEQSNEDSWQWVAKKLSQDNQKLSHQHLLNIAKKNNGITINELIAKTDCTVLEARKVIDELEWLED
ncbi:ribosome recycling factor Rrf [Thalassotalea insulae]|uniref:Ribosome recycling factor Rrf n=1 Tax=Thalassotalea insulae TaxID=2056778 RepID=A0ABQ6GZK2_9GAMM|nr:ribosome recycling factor family protein [Thalassotalea insulae]GLX79997.1 ribosome recycling factor Rrf [Thalassotalea insulae]